MIFLIKEMGDKDSAYLVRKYLSHPHPKVREEALDCLVALEDKELIYEIETLLDDENENIRRKVLFFLSRIGTRKKEHIMKVISILFDEEENTETKKIALRVFLSSGNLKLPDGKTIEDLLIELLEKRKKVLFFSVDDERSIDFKKEIINVLGEIGSSKSLALLKKIEKENRALSESASIAFKKLFEKVSHR